MKNPRAMLAFTLISFVFGSCAFTAVTRSEDITYDSIRKLQLDVYAPKKISQPKNVFVFIHGGRWNSGKKGQYKFLGNRMARKGIVTVIIDYRLSPAVAYKEMTMDAASALKWVMENINTYGGDDARIFVSGHSAGGHLAALVSTDHHYFDSLKIANPVKGAILIDAFGLDMYTFLSNKDYEKNSVYYDMFSTNPEAWKDGSPIYHLREGLPRFILFVGGKTYPAIITGNNEFSTALKKFQPDSRLITMKNKKHLPMIIQFVNTGNKAYDQIIQFMNEE